jgi:hypothetical protein
VASTVGFPFSEKAVDALEKLKSSEINTVILVCCAGVTLNIFKETHTSRNESADCRCY